MIQSNISDASRFRNRAKVELYEGSTLVTTCTCSNYLQDFSLIREGDTSKFFGFGVVHKFVIKLIDLKRELNIAKGNNVEIAIGDGTEFDYPFPTTFITEVERDEKTNDITVTTYDILQATNGLLVSELGLTAPYTLRDVVNAIATKLGVVVIGIDDTFNLSYSEGANFAGDETIREILNAIAEVTQTIYYINNENKLVFKRLDKTGAPVLTIGRGNYFELTVQTPRALAAVCHATELGENIYSGNMNGIVQYVRDNPFWSNRTDLGDLINAAAERAIGTTIYQVDCDWSGNYLLEIGDKVGFIARDGNEVYTYILDDVIDYQGYLSQNTAWEFSQDENVTAANPTSIGEKLNQTFARVDKVNKRIDLVASDVSANSSQLAEIKLTTDDITLRVEKIENNEVEIEVDLENDSNFIALKERVGALEVSDEEIKASVSEVETIINNNTDEIAVVRSSISSLQIESNEISASVKSLETQTTDSLNALDNTVNALAKEVNLKMDADAVTISINKALDEGVDKVKTSSKNYTFDDDGLNISSSDSDFNTVVNENGMRIYKGSTEVLTANNEGVTATDLHARTFLIIGENSRLEDRGSRTACFWIGKAGG